MTTNKEVFENGSVLEHYPCDVDDDGTLKSNASIEYVIEYKGRRYLVLTDWDNNVRRANDTAHEINED